MDYYMIGATNFAVQSINDLSVDNTHGYVQFKLSQYGVKQNSSYKRDTLFDLFILCGAFISMITRITNITIRAYQGYAIDKSLVKKVFSKRENKERN